MVYRVTKRILDIILSFIAIILLLPLFIILSLAIKIDSKGPVFFRQVRVGKNKTLFYINKFRTMRIDTPNDTSTHMLSNPDVYITKLGKFLRKTSLDELPQIWNIFIGNMSIIGPRPALWNQYDLIDERDKYGVNKEKPGLFGLNHLYRYNEFSIDTMAIIDKEYISNINFSIDIQLFVREIIRIMKEQDSKIEY